MLNQQEIEELEAIEPCQYESMCYDSNTVCPAMVIISDNLADKIKDFVFIVRENYKNYAPACIHHLLDE